MSRSARIQKKHCLVKQLVADIQVGQFTENVFAQDDYY